MKLAITGTPGTGKTVLAKSLAKKLKAVVINEKDFALRKKAGRQNKRLGEVEVDVKKLEKELNKELKKHENAIVEGHLLCEARLSVDAIIVLTFDPFKLQKRLEKRGYAPEKVLDNVFCETISYCLEKTKKNYQKQKIIIVPSEKTISGTIKKTISELRGRGFLN
ncbi:MAG: AAA family ATPase [archaeon]|nr:AAA family ATPase [archaeon]